MNHAQREQSLLQVLEAFTKGLTTLKRGYCPRPFREPSTAGRRTTNSHSTKD
ncbi:MAG: hypothetical protein ABI618_06385 [Nitrospirota bacterium]